MLTLYTIALLLVLLVPNPQNLAMDASTIAPGQPGYLVTLLQEHIQTNGSTKKNTWQIPASLVAHSPVLAKSMEMSPGQALVLPGADGTDFEAIKDYLPLLTTCAQTEEITALKEKLCAEPADAVALIANTADYLDITLLHKQACNVLAGYVATHGCSLAEATPANNTDAPLFGLSTPLSTTNKAIIAEQISLSHPIISWLLLSDQLTHSKEVKSGYLPHTELKGHEHKLFSYITAMEFNDQNTLLLTACTDGHLCVWCTETGKLFRKFLLPWALRVAIFNPQSNQVACGSDCGAVVLADLANDSLGPSLITHNTPITAIAFSPSGKRLASCSSNQMVNVFEVKENTHLQSANVFHKAAKHEDVVLGVRFIDENTFISYSRDSCLKIWLLNESIRHTYRFRDEEPMPTVQNDAHEMQTDVVQKNNEAEGFSLDVNKEGTLLAYCVLPENKPRILNIKTMQIVPSFEDSQGHGSAVRHIFFSGNGTHLLTVAGKEAKLWDLETGTVCSFKHDACASLQGAAVDPKGHLLFCTTNDKTGILWHAAGVCLPATFPATMQLKFDHSGHLLATASDTNVWLWQLANPEMASYVQKLTYEELAVLMHAFDCCKRQVSLEFKNSRLNQAFEKMKETNPHLYKTILATSVAKNSQMIPLL